MAIMPIPAAHRNINSTPFRLIFHNMQKLSLRNIKEDELGMISGREALA